MIGYIDGFDFKEMEIQKYWNYPNSWAEQKKKDVTKQRIFSGEWSAAEKKDGYFCQCLKDEDGNIFMLSRSRSVSGEFPNKWDYMPHLQSFYDSLPNGSCVLGELYLPSSPGSRNITTVLGCLKDKAIKRQEIGEKLHFYIFDCLAWNGKSFMKTIAKDRFDFLKTIKDEYSSEFVEFGKYYYGKELWIKLQEYLAQGKEGMVLIRDGSLYQPGKRPSQDTQKIKKELADTIDCFFTGRATAPKKEYSGKEVETWKYWIDSITNQKLAVDEMNNYYADYANGTAIEPVTKSYYYDFAGSLEIAVIDDEGKIVPIGLLSGLTEEIKKNPKNYKGKCIEVSAMEMDTSVYPPTLRHGKMIQFRNDLTINDCTMRKVLGDK